MADESRFVSGAGSDHEHHITGLDLSHLDELCRIARRPEGAALGGFDLHFRVGDRAARARHKFFTRRAQEGCHDGRVCHIIRADLAVHHDFAR
jgi:hypothetical protein